MYQNSPIAMQNSKSFPADSTPDSRFRGEESWFHFSGKVPKRSYSNAEFQKFQELPDPRFWEGEGKLPPLEIMSGYATAHIYIIPIVGTGTVNIYSWTKQTNFNCKQWADQKRKVLSFWRLQFTTSYLPLPWFSIKYFSVPYFKSY